MAGLLAIDVGNTQTVLGLFDGEELREHWRVATESERTGDELGLLLRGLVDLAAVAHRDPGALRGPARGRAGPDRQRGCRFGALRRAVDRRRLRHLDQLRRR